MTATKSKRKTERPMSRILTLASRVLEALRRMDNLAGEPTMGPERTDLHEIIHIATEADARTGKREQSTRPARARGRGK